MSAQLLLLDFNLFVACSRQSHSMKVGYTQYETRVKIGGGLLTKHENFVSKSSYDLRLLCWDGFSSML